MSDGNVQRIWVTREVQRLRSENRWLRGELRAACRRRTCDVCGVYRMKIDPAWEVPVWDVAWGALRWGRLV